MVDLAYETFLLFLAKYMALSFFLLSEEDIRGLQ